MNMSADDFHLECEKERSVISYKGKNPEITKGTILAQENRKVCNALSEKHRNQLQKEALDLFRRDDSSESLLLHMMGLSTRSVDEAILKYLDLPDCSHETRVAVFTHLQGDPSGY